MEEIALEASVGQRLLWLLSSYRGAEGALNCPILCRVRGRLDIELIHHALHQVEQRHEALRTTFERRGVSLYQRIHASRGPILSPTDVTAEQLAVEIADEQARGIDATVWPVRLRLWRLASDEHVLSINMHHLVTDAWSCGVVFRDVWNLYRKQLGQLVELPAVSWQYRDYCAWQLEAMRSPEWHSHRAYWSRQLGGARPASAPLVEGGDHEPRGTTTAACEIDADTVRHLAALGRAQHSSLFNVMLAVCYVWLARVTGSRDVAVASVFANRDRAELKEMVGFVANMVVLRTRVPHAVTFRELTRESHATVMGALLHQEFPLQLLPPNTMKERPDLVFQMLPEPVPVQELVSGLEVEALVPEGVGSRFALELALVPRGDHFRAVLFYNRGRLDRARAEAALAEYVKLAREAARDPDQLIDRMDGGL